MDDTVRLILRWLIVPVLFLVFLYALAVAGMVAANLAQPQQDYMQVAVRLKDDLGVAAFEVWRFVRPLLQLGIVLLLLRAFLRTIGVDLGLKATVTQEASIQTVLAFVVVGGFALAALVSENPASWLKDLALVVVGFYFGTRAKDWDDRKGELGPDLTPPKPQAGGKSSTQPEVPHNQTAVGPDLGPRMDPSTLPTYQEFKQSRDGNASHRRS
jgi:hypothetical protein